MNHICYQCHKKRRSTPMAHRRQILCCIRRLDGDEGLDNRAFRKLFRILSISHLPSVNEKEFCAVFMFGHSILSLCYNSINILRYTKYFYHQQRKPQILVKVYSSSPQRHRYLNYTNTAFTMLMCHTTRSTPGCTVCKITLECGAQLI